MDVFPSVQPEHLMEFHLEVQAKYFSKDTLEILLQQPNEVRKRGEFDLLSTPLIPSINPTKYALLFPYSPRGCLLQFTQGNKKVVLCL